MVDNIIQYIEAQAKRIDPRNIGPFGGPLVRDSGQRDTMMNMVMTKVNTFFCIFPAPTRGE